MNRWPHSIESTTVSEITEYCVNDALWQRFRLSLKGVSTPQKLDRLYARHGEALVLAPDGQSMRRVQVQTDNYLNALKRGGQLNDHNEVVR